MCRGTVDIQSATAQPLRLGMEKRRRKKKERNHRAKI